jgi:hypothetical protein
MKSTILERLSNLTGVEIRGETVVSRNGALVQVFIWDKEDEQYLFWQYEIDEDVAAHIKKELSRGYDVKYKGVTQFLEWDVIFDRSKKGSAAYTWDKSGKKVKHTVTLVSRDSDGNITREDKGTTWRKF